MAMAKGTSPLAVGVETPLLEELKAFAEGRGQTLRYVVERALRRHMDSPPPLVPDPPLPAGEPEPGRRAAAKKARGKKS